MSLLETVAALLVVAIVSTGAAAFLIGAQRGLNGQKQRQGAVYVAGQKLEDVRSLDARFTTSTSNRSKLVVGRTQSSVQSLLASPAATRMRISSQDDVTTSLSLDYDPSATSSSTPVVNTVDSIPRNGTTYTVSTFIDVCWINPSTSLNAGSVSTCGPTQVDSTYIEDYRVSVDVAWSGRAPCQSGCSYGDSTLIDPLDDNKKFNNNVQVPTFSITKPTTTDGAGHVAVNIANNAPSDAAPTHCGGTSNYFVLTGSSFQSGLSVKISAGGGTISSVTQPDATHVTFCLSTATSDPAQYTITVINPDFGLAKQTVVEQPYITSAGSYSSSAKTITLTGNGFLTGATATCSWSSSCSGTRNSNTSVVVSNYVPASGTITVTNTNGTKATWTVAASAPPTITAVSGYSSSANTATLTGTNFAAGSTARCTPSSSCTGATFTASTTSATLNGYVPPANGGTVTIAITTSDGVTGPNFTITAPTIASASGWTTSSPTLTLTGTNFASGISLQSCSGMTCGTLSRSSATSLAIANVTGPTDGSTGRITVANPDGSTATWTITAPTITGATASGSINHGSTVNATMSGTGFVSSPTKSVFTVKWVKGSTTSGPYTATSVTVSSSTSASMTLQTPPTSGTYTVTITVYNPDGSSDFLTVTNVAVN